MLLHELATNALKYGALSQEGGTVEVGWRVERDDAPILVLDWNETGGPAVSARPCPRSSSSRTSEAPPARPVVLVVEDNPVLSMTMVDFVEDAGLRGRRGVLGRRGHRNPGCAHRHPHGVYGPRHRGSTAGMHLAVAIRDRWPPIELVMLSSNPKGERNVLDRGLLLGKPFDRRRIVAALRSFAG